MEGEGCLTVRPTSRFRTNSHKEFLSTTVLEEEKVESRRRVEDQK